MPLHVARPGKWNVVNEVHNLKKLNFEVHFNFHEQFDKYIQGMHNFNISDMALFTGVNIYVTSIYSSPYYHLLPNVWEAWYTNNASIFVDIPYWPPYRTVKGLSRRKCPVFKKTKLRILIIIWIITEIWTLNFMFLTRKLAGSINYVVFGALFYNGERKKINVPKGGRFCRVCEHKD